MAWRPIPRVVFLGEKPFAEKCLADLLKRRCKVVAVCTREKDENIWWGTNKIKDMGVPVVSRKKIVDLEVDILISVLYPFIIEPEIIASAKKAFNLHLAPLPEYKGCNTGSHALMRGDESFGVTLHEMTWELDCGRIVEKRYFPLTITDTAKTLYEKAVQTGFEVWKQNIDSILNGTVELQESQEDNSAPFSRQSLEAKQISTKFSRTDIYDFVRGLDFEPFEPAYFLDGSEKIYLKQKDFDIATLKLADPILEAKLEEYLGRDV